MKVLLIAPPVFDYYFSPHRAEPLGLFYLKAAVEQALPSVEVTLYDARKSGKRRQMSAPACFDHLQKYYLPDQSQFALFSRYTRFGDSFAKIARKVVEGNFDVVAVSSLFSGYHDDVEELMAHVRTQTGVILVCGGWAVKAAAANLINRTAADYLVTGDEEAFVALLEALQNGEAPGELPDVWRKGQHAPAARGSRCSDPFFLRGLPQRTGFGMLKGEVMASVTLSRGCGMRCAFCAIHRAGPYLRRPLPHIESELASLAASGVCIVNFEDDHLFSDHASTEPLLEMLGAFHTRGMGFMAMNGITAPRLAPHIDAALDAGFRECNLSLVSADPKVAAQIERPVFLPAIRKIAEHSLGRAAVVVFIILGLPGQSPKTALEDLLTLAALPVTLGVSPLYLLPGIPLFEDMGLPAASRLMRGSALYRFSPGFSREDVVALWKLTRMLGAIKRSAASPEHLHYFGRSLATGSWHRLHEEKWLTFIDNPLVLPDCVAVTTTEGAKLSWYPLRGECR